MHQSVLVRSVEETKKMIKLMWKDVDVLRDVVLDHDHVDNALAWTSE